MDILFRQMEQLCWCQNKSSVFQEAPLCPNKLCNKVEIHEHEHCWNPIFSCKWCTWNIAYEIVFLLKIEQNNRALNSRQFHICRFPFPVVRFNFRNFTWKQKIVQIVWNLLKLDSSHLLLIKRVTFVDLWPQLILDSRVPKYGR